MNEQHTSGTTARWDAGHAGCGKLIAGLRRRMGQLQPGDLLEITARDAAASIDLAAWCRMTNHHLISSEHPMYVIQRNPADIRN